MDRTSPPARRTPQRQPGVRWGLGDFFWVYFGGIFAGALLGSIGHAVSGDRPGHLGALAVGLSFFGQFGGWVLGLIAVSRRKGRGTLAEDLGLRVRPRDAWALLAGVVLQIVLVIMVLPLVHLVGNQHQDVVKQLDEAHGVTLALIAVTAGLVAPVCEELLFRGLLLRALRRRMPVEWAVVVSALVFAVAHPALDPTLGTVAVVPALLALGAISAVFAVRRGDLSVSIFLHIGFNLLTTVSALHK